MIFPGNIDIDKIYTTAFMCGYESQSRQLIEEMAKLTQAINKKWKEDSGIITYNKDHIRAITEEMAGVIVCLEQVQILLNIPDEKIENIIDRKLIREERRAEALATKGDK
jgi:hypothetical protein|uniref:Nucleoside triphosphate pyrophosphohydrolase n=1 Tax=Siphoviridae sp. ctX926 TaxID=2826366 RepID=A0A8S5M133_9CAUD|nr:MAG TPA: nucleoside triphosphate pyrophosphohydrolase [Siphoviridae sp. ctX926]